MADSPPLTEADIEFLLWVIGFCLDCLAIALHDEAKSSLGRLSRHQTVFSPPNIITYV
ncbi:hypothetical protein [Spirulina major]|uniref:hypothetical protein n=1 Tax=Spirulina major TaxID=270636 RepID=UPI0015879B49|nr:hypothetical protein [Spirulina major]